MVTVRDVLATLERLAPAELALEWDNVGLQVGDPGAEVTHALVSLDASLLAVRHAARVGAQLLLTHHPLLFSSPKRLDVTHGPGAVVAEAIRHGVTIVAAHTNWDHAADGLNDALARHYALLDVHPFGTGPELALATLVVYAPKGSEERLIEAMAEAGAGCLGPYRRCAFTSFGVGTFEPLEGAHPAIGEVGRRESVDEARIKMVLPLSRREAVLAAMRAAHPYEMVAHSLLPIIGGMPHPAGRIGRLRRPLDLSNFLSHIGAHAAWGPKKTIERVAVVGGAADSEWTAALAAGADAFVTGEVKHHNALAAAEAGLLIVAAGHYETEDPGMAHLAERMMSEFPDVLWQHVGPEEGSAGRPW